MVVGSFLSYVGFFVESTVGFIAIMGVIALVIGYLAWEWTAAKRDLAAEADEQRARREALGVPEWKPESDHR